jgi:hypothetical protein
MELHNSLREMSEKAATLEARNAELEARNTELVINVQKLETRVNAVQMESFREKRHIESQFNARVQVLESEHRAKLEDTKAAASAARNAICEVIARQFSGLLDGLTISESTVESALQAVRRKIDQLAKQESFLRGTLRLDPAQPIEEAVSALLQPRRRRSAYM